MSEQWWFAHRPGRGYTKSAALGLRSFYAKFIAGVALIVVVRRLGAYGTSLSRCVIC